MQPVSRPYSVALPVLASLTGLSLLLLAAGSAQRALGFEVHTGRSLQIVGLVGAALFGLLGLGTWVYARRLRGALAAMQSGQLIGSWVSTVGGGEVPIDLGVSLAVVAGELLPFAVHNQRTTQVRLDAAECQLIVHGVYDNGNGDVSFTQRLPFDPEDRALVSKCGALLARRHSVAFEEG